MFCNIFKIFHCCLPKIWLNVYKLILHMWSSVLQRVWIIKFVVCVVFVITTKIQPAQFPILFRCPVWMKKGIYSPYINIVHERNVCKSSNQFGSFPAMSGTQMITFWKICLIHVFPYLYTSRHNDIISVWYQSLKKRDAILFLEIGLVEIWYQEQKAIQSLIKNGILIVLCACIIMVGYLFPHPPIAIQFLL